MLAPGRESIRLLPDRMEQTLRSTSATEDRSAPGCVQVRSCPSGRRRLAAAPVAPRKGATGEVAHLPIDVVISIHAPARGATINCIEQFHVTNISIHAPAGGATGQRLTVAKERFQFQSTLPQGERPNKVISQRRHTEHFNPRSRKGSDAPWRTWAATIGYFNPRSRKGSDIHLVLVRHVAGVISIHAPARGATRSEASRSSARWYFNPRSRKGSDLPAEAVSVEPSLFQSTLPQGERPSHGRQSNPAGHFNPRSRKGSDASVQKYIANAPLFQSTLPQGERPDGR